MRARSQSWLLRTRRLYDDDKVSLIRVVEIETFEDFDSRNWAFIAFSRARSNIEIESLGHISNRDFFSEVIILKSDFFNKKSLFLSILNLKTPGKLPQTQKSKNFFLIAILCFA
jgi:hypothetical protein